MPYSNQIRIIVKINGFVIDILALYHALVHPGKVIALIVLLVTKLLEES